MSGEGKRKPHHRSDVVLEPDSKTWAGLYLSTVPLNNAVESGKVNLTGDRDGVTRIFDISDKFKPTGNYTVLPLED